MACSCETSGWRSARIDRRTGNIRRTGDDPDQVVVAPAWIASLTAGRQSFAHPVQQTDLFAHPAAIFAVERNDQEAQQHRGDVTEHRQDQLARRQPDFD